jgi:hypothetical protein
MGRLGLVAPSWTRSWRVYAGPVALLLAATVLVGLLRGHGSGRNPARAKPAPAAHARPAARPAPHVHAVYVVRAGDTLAAISSRTGIPLARLVALNPKVSPTALFIGEKLNLR